VVQLLKYEQQVLPRRMHRHNPWFISTVMTALARLTRFDVCAEWCLPA
jgi:hypothetical protein